jgi:hypothetical protein
MLVEITIALVVASMAATYAFCLWHSERYREDNVKMLRFEKLRFEWLWSTLSSRWRS